MSAIEISQTTDPSFVGWFNHTAASLTGGDVPVPTDNTRLFLMYPQPHRPFKGVTGYIVLRMLDDEYCMTAIHINPRVMNQTTSFIDAVLRKINNNVVVNTENKAVIRIITSIGFSSEDASGVFRRHVEKPIGGLLDFLFKGRAGPRRVAPRRAPTLKDLHWTFLDTYLRQMLCSVNAKGPLDTFVGSDTIVPFFLHYEFIGLVAIDMIYIPSRIIQTLRLINSHQVTVSYLLTRHDHDVHPPMFHVNVVTTDDAVDPIDLEVRYPVLRNLYIDVNNSTAPWDTMRTVGWDIMPHLERFTVHGLIDLFFISSEHNILRPNFTYLSVNLDPIVRWNQYTHFANLRRVRNLLHNMDTRIDGQIFSNRLCTTAPNLTYLRLDGATPDCVIWATFSIFDSLHKEMHTLELHHCYKWEESIGMVLTNRLSKSMPNLRVLVLVNDKTDYVSDNILGMFPLLEHAYLDVNFYESSSRPYRIEHLKTLSIIPHHVMKDGAAIDDDYINPFFHICSYDSLAILCFLASKESMVAFLNAINPTMWMSGGLPLLRVLTIEGNPLWIFESRLLVPKWTKPITIISDGEIDWRCQKTSKISVFPVETVHTAFVAGIDIDCSDIRDKVKVMSDIERYGPDYVKFLRDKTADAIRYNWLSTFLSPMATLSDIADRIYDFSSYSLTIDEDVLGLYSGADVSDMINKTVDDIQLLHNVLNGLVLL